MKNIAVCIRGEYRTWEKTHKAVLKYFGNNVDYFFCTWDESYDDYGNHGEMRRITKKDIEKTFEGYNLVDCRVLSMVKHVRKFMKYETMMTNVTFLMHTIWEHCNQLKYNHETKNDALYSYVIGVRPDQVYHTQEKLDLAMLKRVQRDYFSIMTDGVLASDNGFYDLYAPDRIIIANSKITDIMCDFLTYLKYDLDDWNRIPDSTHNTFAHYMLERKLIFEYDQDYKPISLGNTAIVREGYDKEITEVDIHVLHDIQRYHEKWWKLKYDSN